MMGILMQGVWGYITSPYAMWFPVAAAGASAIIGIIAMIYMLSTFTGRQDLKVWARTKIYEVLMSILLIFVFFAIITLLASQNFEQLFNSVNLVPTGCQSLPKGATDFFTLSVCDMYQFNNNVISLGGVVYDLGALSAFIPEIKFNVGGVEASDNPIMPGVSSMLGYLVSIVFATFVLSQVQLLLLAASLLLFSLLMGIGLIARIFSVTRSFGGAMIALGIGLGVLYPVLVCLTYGYINVQMERTSVQVVGGIVTGAEVTGGIFASTTLLTNIPSLIILLSGGVMASNPSALFQNWVIALLTYSGMAGAGLILIPFLNFIIVDVFVIDFSQAVGERMDFLRLFTALV
jgi:hypothetical protein